jgi:hypothetical protein
MQAIAEQHLAPLLALGRDDWWDLDQYREWSAGINESIAAIPDPQMRREVVLRYLMPLEESINDLFFHWIRGVTRDLHNEAARGMILFLCSTIVWNLFAHILPGGVAIDRVVIAGCTAAIAVCVVETLGIFSWVWQETRDETEFIKPSSDLDEDDDDTVSDANGAADV